MIRVIVTTDGTKIHRSMKGLDGLSCQQMRDALVGCGTNDDNSSYVEIAEVYFLPEYDQNS
jgi:hypothetical protein